MTTAPSCPSARDGDRILRQSTRCWQEGYHAGQRRARLADYGNTRGPLALRRLLVRQFAGEGIEIGADQILLTASGTQAIDLICRTLLQPGDTVLLDDPCYFNFQALLRVHRVKLVSVPYTPIGPDASLFAETLATHRLRIYITNSALHNPTGATMSPQTAHRLLNAAAAHDLIIIEDDIFADFEPLSRAKPRGDLDSFGPQSPCGRKEDVPNPCALSTRRAGMVAAVLCLHRSL